MLPQGARPRPLPPHPAGGRQSVPPSPLPPRPGASSRRLRVWEMDATPSRRWTLEGASLRHPPLCPGDGRPRSRYPIQEVAGCAPHRCVSRPVQEVDSKTARQCGTARAEPPRGARPRPLPSRPGGRRLRAPPPPWQPFPRGGHQGCLPCRPEGHSLRLCQPTQEVDGSVSLLRLRHPA